MEAERWKKINEIFSHWLEQESEKRNDYLNEACRGDESLRKEVDLLIDAYLKSKSFIETPVLDDAVHATAKSITPKNLMSPNYPSPYYWLGLSYLEKQNYNEAIKALQNAVTLSHRAPVALSGLGIGFARAGMMKEANSILNELLDAQKNTYVPEFYLATLYAALGRKDEAFEWLEKAYQERANGPSGLKILPILDNLRSDPRFEEFLKRLKLN